MKVQTWWNFTWAVESLQFCTLMGSFCPNHINFQLKNTEQLSLMTLKSDAKFKEKLLWFKIWHEEFGEFPTNHSKVWTFLFNRLFLSKVYKIWATKIQRSYLSWHQTMMQNLNKPRSCGFKNGIRNWVNFH